MKIFFQEYKSSRIWVGLYYLLLILILSLWGNGGTSPNMSYKIVYYICLLFPALLNQSDYVPMLIVGFSGVALYGYAYTFMPTYLPVYLVSLFGFYFLFIKSKHFRFKLPNIVILFGLYTLFVDLIMNLSIENITYSVFIIVILGRYLNNDIEWNAISKYSAGLSLVTLVLSTYFIIFQDRFTEDYYAQGSGLERSGWMDPNYFGMVIGMGTVAAMVQITKYRELGIIEKFFYIITIAISIPTLVLNASRGSLLAVAFSFAILLVFSKVGRIYKIFILAVIFGFIIYLYNNSYFDLLEYRVLNDSGTGSGRTEIWEQKLNAFYSGEKLYWIIGYGNVGGKELGMSYAFGSHNDYVAILCAYGFVGLSMFISMLVYPIIKLKKNATNKCIVIAVTIYMVIVCMTLEPYTAGRLPYFSYLLYALLIMSAANSQKL